MSHSRFDWRWIAAFVFIAIIVGAQRLPWPIVMLALAAGGGYLLYYGWQVWNRQSSGGGGRVTYWRGQRIDLQPQRQTSRPSLRSIGPALFYLIVGGVLVISALALLIRQLGIM
jgi:hypothetical protein